MKRGIDFFLVFILLLVPVFISTKGLYFMKKEVQQSDTLSIATFGAGCFWCVEAIFEDLKGVVNVVSGYSGGSVPNPTYEEVCSGLTSHAEVCQITFNPREISFSELLEIFWQTHDPTTLNRQGADIGTQYRSVIFYHNSEQKDLAERFKRELDASDAWEDPLVTEVVPFEVFYVAGSHHQDYYINNYNHPYCSYVIKPKLEKFRKVFSDKVIERKVLEKE